MECFRKYSSKDGPYTYKRNLFATRNKTRPLRPGEIPEEAWQIQSRFHHMPWWHRLIIPVWTLLLVFGIMFHISALAVASQIRKASTQSKMSERKWRSFAILVFLGMIVAPSLFLGIVVSHAVDDLKPPPSDEPRSTPIGVTYRPPPPTGGLGSIALSTSTLSGQTRSVSFLNFVRDVLDNKWIFIGMFLTLLVFFITIGSTISITKSDQDSPINITDQTHWGLFLLYLVLFFATLLVPFCFTVIARWITRHMILNTDLHEDRLPEDDPATMPELTPYTTINGKDMVGTAIAPAIAGNRDYNLLNWMLGGQRLGGFFTYPVKSVGFDTVFPLLMPVAPGMLPLPDPICPPLTGTDQWARGRILVTEAIFFIIPILFVIVLLWSILTDMKHIADQDPTNKVLRSSKRYAWGFGIVCWCICLYLLFHWGIRIVRVLYLNLP